jgi:prepilin-type N-terminal cleavage/methylation domain-containing protein
MNFRRLIKSFEKQSLPAQTSNAAGFTLIEILVAITIFAFAVLGLAIGTVSVIRTNQTSYLRTNAINLAQARFEELRSMTGAAFAGLSCPSTTPCSDSPVASGVTFTRSWWITANSPVTGVSRIDVQVNWTDYTSQSLTFVASFPQ